LLYFRIFCYCSIYIRFFIFRFNCYIQFLKKITKNNKKYAKINKLLCIHVKNSSIQAFFRSMYSFCILFVFLCIHFVFIPIFRGFWSIFEEVEITLYSLCILFCIHINFLYSFYVFWILKSPIFRAFLCIRTALHAVGDVPSLPPKG